MFFYFLNIVLVLTPCVHGVCLSGVLLESFPVCKELLIPPGTQNYVVRMRLYDTNKHLLCLTIRIILRAQGALKILISSPYWLINKTGNVFLWCYKVQLYILLEKKYPVFKNKLLCCHSLKQFFSLRSAVNFPSGQR